MSVSCTINISELTDVLAVPINAVQINGDRKYVVVMENGETKEVDIETGLSNDNYVEVKSGLTGGEIVQVVTTTKQSTIRNNSNKSSDSKMNSKGMGEMPGQGGQGMQVPNMDGGSKPSGSRSRGGAESND